MKKKYIYIAFAFFFAGSLFAQTTETFETETDNSSSFTDNGQVFNISSQAGGTFKLTNVAGTGWNGVIADDKYIDNSNTADQGISVQFTIKSAAATSFKLKSIYLFLSKNDLTAGSGSCTLTGKLSGSTVFTATSSTGFNSNLIINNGFTLIDLTTFGGDDNSNKAIDEYVISTTGEFEYVALDAMSWEKIIPLKVDEFDTNDFKFYPNPIKDNLNLSYSKEITSVKVFNMVGQTLLEKSINTSLAQINMSGFPSGTYFVEVKSLDSYKTFKVIKN